MTQRGDVQAAYIAELRELQPGLLRWWTSLGGLASPDDPPPAEVLARWPFGIAGHPRVIEVFRRHFLALDALNQSELAEHGEPESRDPASEEGWGEDDSGERLGYQRPQDLLIFEIPAIAPDLAKLVAGIVYVPVGLNQYDEAL